MVVAKYDYYPYGGLRASTVSTDTKVRFTGKYYDGEDVSQYYFGARYLNDLTNRFNSVDPAAGKYPGWSPYAYCADNPLRNVDPDGRTLSDFLKGLYASVLDNALFINLRSSFSPTDALDYNFGQDIGDILRIGLGPRKQSLAAS